MSPHATSLPLPLATSLPHSDRSQPPLHARAATASRQLSLRHIASRAKVSVVAVSYALRGVGGVSDATRRRILAVAESLGYRPDPLLSHLMYHLRSRKAANSTHNLAFLHWRKDSFSQLVVDGARAQADRHGYPMDVLEMNHHCSSPRTLPRMLKARGISGLLIGPSADRDLGDLLEWQDFAVVTTSYAVQNPRFHRVVPNQFSAAQLAVRTLQQRGFRRIGLIVPPWVEERVNYFHSAAVAWEASRENANPLVCYHDPDEQPLEHLRQWCQAARPDALVLCGPLDFETVLCRAVGRSAVARMGIVSLGYDTPCADTITVDYQPMLLGSIAVDQLISQLHRQERGIPQVQQTLSVEARWSEDPHTAAAPVPIREVA